jgi:hypothetical protein
MFREVIDYEIGLSAKDYKSQLKTLIGSKFQLFDDLEQINPNTYIEKKEGKSSENVQSV